MDIYYSADDINTKKASLENYDEYPWSHKHFQEFKELSTLYNDFIVWRRAGPFKGETINIDSKGVRQTLHTKKTDSNLNLFYFFGGSTMWGTGVSDKFTIPSLFSKEFGIKSINYGESGYTARQSLAMMINKYTQMEIDKSGNSIVYYDGINDVANMCRSEIKGQSTPQEGVIRYYLENNPLDYSYIFRPIVELANKVKRKIYSSRKSKLKYRDCHSNREKAKHVAQSLVKTWSIAAEIANKNGDNFLAILQPVSFIGNSDTSHLSSLNLTDKVNLEKQYLSVYPLIRQYASKNKKLNFIDFSNIYDNKKVYIDFFHVSPQGNMLVINQLKKYKKLLNFH
jgi:hypothetical protein